jgi:nucleotide-binding universal stress UspA family protein
MKVLLAIDHSPVSARVVEAALARPWPARSSFCVVNCVDLTWYAELPALVADATHEAKRLVREAAAKLFQAGLTSETRVITGLPRHAIATFAAQSGVDLILVGSHGRRAIGRFLLGSVAQGILRAAQCSVEIVRGKTDSHARSPLKVLLATDGSACSVAATRITAARPWHSETVFRIVSVEELVVPGNEMAAASLSSVYPPSLLEKLCTESRNRAHAAVEEARSILTGTGNLAIEGTNTPVGDPRVAILEAATSWQPDLIVLGSHGRSGLDRLLLGSVSETVAVHAACSVQVVRPPKEAPRS